MVMIVLRAKSLSLAPGVLPRQHANEDKEVEELVPISFEAIIVIIILSVQSITSSQQPSIAPLLANPFH